MNIAHILNQVRKKRVNYNKGGDFTIPLKWERTPTMTFAKVSKEHAKMIVAASGRDFTPHAIYLPNSNDSLGIGNAAMTVIPARDGSYILRHDRRTLDGPSVLPTSIDLSQKLKTPEAPDTRPTEMTPEDFYM